jgi:RNA polymerase sigma-70 factor (sigma-E family)
MAETGVLVGDDDVRASDATFEDFMSAALPGLLRFGFVLTGNPHRAEELVQEALVKTYRRWRRLRLEQPHAYVRRAMVTTYTSWWRRGRRETALPPGFDEPAAGSDPDAYAERDAAVRALLTLPPRQRAVLVLRYYEDYSEADIAETMGCSTGTVKSQASRGLRALRTLLGEPDEASPQDARTHGRSRPLNADNEEGYR